MDNFIKKMSKAIDVLEKTEIVIGCFTLCLFILMVTYQVVARFLAVSAYFTEEISTTAFIWTAFMGSSVMLRRYEHYRFTGVAEKLKGKAFIINESICLIILLIVSILMSVHGVRLAIMFSTWRFSSLKISRTWLWICLPISGITSTIYVLEAIIKFIHDPSTRAVKSEADKLLEEADV